MNMTEIILKKVQLISYLIIVFGVMNCITVHAQDNHKEKELMIVYLKDGSTIKGTIIDWNYEEALQLRTTDGLELTFPAKAIDKVTQASLYKVTVPYNFKENGLYYAVRGQYIVGNDGRRAKEQGGYGFSALVGHRFNRLLGIGIGTGYDLFIDNTGERLMPIFTEVSGYLLPKNSSFSYSLAVGYSFAFTDADYNLNEAKGGLLIYPAVGLRFGTGEMKYTVDLGYKFQNAIFTYTNPWDGTSRDRHDILYKRLTLRMGILF